MFCHLNVLEVKEHCFEFEECNYFILLYVMFVKYFVKVFLSYVVAYFVHSCHYIILRNVSGAVRVKLIKNGLQLIIIQECLYVQGCHQEL